MDDLVLVEADAPGICVITLNRAEKRNALSIPLMERLSEAVESVNETEARVLILRGNGPVFCAGLDLKEAMEEDRAHRSAECVRRMLQSVAMSRIVTMAAVHGAAVAGGAGLMSACDIVVASEEARIGYPEVRRGLVAGLVMTFLRRQLRERDARELLLLAELIDAGRARDLGLVNRVVPAGQAFDAAFALAQELLKCAPEALAHTKHMLRELWPRSVEDDLEWALEHHKTIRASHEAREGIEAFNEKRPPKWDPTAAG